MKMRDSGFIDLFAIHEAGCVPPAAPSSPPPAVSFDTSEDDFNALASARRQTRLYAKIAGGVMGALAVMGVLSLAIGASSGKPEKAEIAAKPAAVAAVAPPPAMTVPAPIAVATTTTPASTAAPAATPEPAKAAPSNPNASAKKAKADYTPQTAAAAYATSQGAPGKGKKAHKAKAAGGMKLQKVQSSGT